MTENYTYYVGFEGEPEYTFCLYENNHLTEKNSYMGRLFR